MPVCKALSSSAAIGPLGTVRPCCAWNNNSGKESQLGENFRYKHAAWAAGMTGDNWLPECQECRQAEQRDGRSLRTYFNEILEYSQDIEYWDFKINNTCNLACRMCDPVNSSTWVAVQKQIDPDYQQKTQRWHKDIDKILPELYTAKVVKFTGGEPFLIPQVKKIVEFLVDEDIAPAVILQFITNGTQDIEPWYELFEFFKNVTVISSVDAVGDRFEYIRQGASWKAVSENLININNSKPSNTFLSVTCLPQALNTGYTHEVEDWCKQHKIRFNLASDCYEPDYMRPDALKDPVLRDKLVRKMEILDMIHGTNYRDFI